MVRDDSSSFNFDLNSYSKRHTQRKPVILEFLLRYHLSTLVPDSAQKLIDSAEDISVLGNIASQLGMSLDIQGSVEEVRERIKTFIVDRVNESLLSLTMSEVTINNINGGGIHDIVCGGFHRYSVDKMWHIPHFEKMLYDQAQLLSVASELYLITKKDFHADVSFENIWNIVFI